MDYFCSNLFTHCNFSVIIYLLVWFFYLCLLRIKQKRDLRHWKPKTSPFSFTHLSIYSVIHIFAYTQILPNEEGTICSNHMHVFDGADFIIRIFVLFYKWQCPPCSVFFLTHTHIHKWKLCWFSESMLFSSTECESQSSWAECRGNALGEISTNIQHCAQCKLN